MFKTFLICVLAWYFSPIVNSQEKVSADPLISAMCAEIHRDSVKSYIKQLQTFGTRHSSMSNRKTIAEWIRKQFVRMGYTNAYLDSFSLSGNWQYNAVATLTGTMKPDSVYILGAHYDCTSDAPAVYAPGADDNGSGVSAVLEIARIFKKRHYAPAGSIRFIAFGSEETGLDGSNDYATKARAVNQRIQIMINNDMISYCADSTNDWKIRLVYYPNSSDVTALASQMTLMYTSLGVWENDADIHSSDSWEFYQKGYKTIYLEEKTNTPYYHTQLDRIQFCNIPYTVEMIKVSCAILMHENGTSTIDVTEPAVTTSDFVLNQNYPNPFNPTTTFSYYLPKQTAVTLAVYNTMGQSVRVLVRGMQHQGQYQVVWDGKDDSGHLVASGIYVYRIQTPAFSKSLKMILLR